jgi:hypothetical protein
MVGEELAIDEAQIALAVNAVPVRLLASDQSGHDLLITQDGKSLSAIESAPPMAEGNTEGLVYQGSELLKKLYLQEARQEAANVYRLYYNSAIKLLDASYHVGGLYTGETVSSILPGIMGSAAYTLDNDVGLMQVYGWLPYDTRRNNLQKLLMAVGAHIRDDSSGKIAIVAASSIPTGTIGPERVFHGGKIERSSAITAVRVTEHSYHPSDEVRTLYDGTVVGTSTIVFGEPMHSLTVTGGTITESGANYCVISANGTVTLTGKTYTHTQRVVSRGAGTSVRAISDNHLISPFNAELIADALLSYYSCDTVLKQDVIVGTERPGDAVYVTMPYGGGMTRVTIRSMDIELAHRELRARTELIVGYTPPSLLPVYSHYAVLTGSGTWTVPAGVTRIRVIVCGPGQGGQGGSGGSQPPRYDRAGAGGEGGAGGTGGKILEAGLAVSPGAGISYSAGSGTAGGGGGSGGSGAPTSGAPGNPGASAATPSAATFGPLSSNSGRSYPQGHYEPKTGYTIGADGPDGVKGGDGAGDYHRAENVTFSGQTWYGGYSTELGGGGGAAVGANGGNPYWSGSYSYYGGDGATATIAGAAATSYGCGGGGGHGGGGGGGVVNDGAPATNGYTGGGGGGSPGGAGGDGIIIIYY